MDTTYYDTLDRMEKAGVDADYRVGWASGFLGNPGREEQRITAAYEAGYTDGAARNTENFGAWQAASA